MRGEKPRGATVESGTGAELELAGPEAARPQARLEARLLQALRLLKEGLLQ